MKRNLLGGIIAVLVGLIVIFIMEKIQVDPVKEENEPEKKVIVPKSEPLDDPYLDDHQVALKELYIEIPFQKNDVVIDRTVKEDDTVVDILDKNTGEILYTYGESNGDKKSIYRLVKTEFTKVKIEVFIELDMESGQIAEVIDKIVHYDPMPKNDTSTKVFAGSRSGDFPAKKVEVLAHGNGRWEEPGQNEEIYEGFLFGVRQSD